MLLRSSRRASELTIAVPVERVRRRMTAQCYHEGAAPNGGVGHPGAGGADRPSCGRRRAAADRSDVSASEQLAQGLDAPEQNPHCILTTGCNALNEGLDLVVEGDAVRVSDDATLRRIAGAYESKDGKRLPLSTSTTASFSTKAPSPKRGTRLGVRG